MMFVILKYTVSENYKSLISHNNTLSKKSPSSDKHTPAINLFCNKSVSVATIETQVGKVARFDGPIDLLETLLWIAIAQRVCVRTFARNKQVT